MWFVRVASIVGLLSLSCCTSTLDGGYAGQDGGTLVVGLGVQKMFGENFELQFRRVDQSSDGSLAWNASGFGRGPVASAPPDFHDAAGTGWVLVRDLPPGEYELYNAAVRYYGQIWTDHYIVQSSGFHLKNDFSVRFTIAPHRATYIGRYVGWSQASYHQDQMTGGFLMVVTDHAEEDIATARRAHAQIGAAADASPDPDTANVPFLFSPQRLKKLMTSTANAPAK
jgi:hypothetical protein